MIGICVSVSLGWSISLHATEKPPLDINWACNLITGLDARGDQNEKPVRNIEVVSPEQQTVKLVFKPAVTEWKVVRLSILDHNGSTIAEARATPPCKEAALLETAKGQASRAAAPLSARTGRAAATSKKLP